MLKTEVIDGVSSGTCFRYDGGVSFDEWKDGAKEVEFVGIPGDLGIPGT